VGSTNFNGAGQFKFALVMALEGTTTVWSNDGTSVNGSERSAAVTITVTNGLYSVLLGDTSIANMTAVPSSVFTHPNVRLRVWFNDGTNGSQLLTPDQPIGAVGYAFMADLVRDGAVTGANIFTGIQTIIGDGSMARVQAATAGTASYMEFDDSTGGTLFRGILGADG